MKILGYKVPKSKVWSLYNHKDNNLFCCHHLGTFLLLIRTSRAD